MATQLEISLFVKGAEISSPQGISVVKLNAQVDPSAPGEDCILTGYAVDSDKNIFGYNPTFTSAELYTIPKDIETPFFGPHGVDATPEGEIYVADTSNKRIVQLFNDNGKIQFSSCIYGFSKPYAVSHNAKKDIFVTDYEDNTIKVINKNGKPINSFKNAIINQPTGIVVVDPNDIWVYYKTSFIVFINQNGTELVKLDLNGNVIKTLNLKQYFNKEVKLEYLTADYYSQILVTDSRNSTIYKFDKDLNYVTSFGRFGMGDYEFVEPKGISIWRRFGQLFITEKTGGQYYWVAVDINNFDCTSSADKFDVAFKITEPAVVNLHLYDTKKKLAKTCMTNQTLLNYQNNFSYPWKDDSGNTLNKGKYTLQIVAVATYCSKNIFKKILEKEIIKE